MTQNQMTPMTTQTTPVIPLTAKKSAKRLSATSVVRKKVSLSPQLKQKPLHLKPLQP